MIRYTVRCKAGHDFEGWYKDSKTYESLQTAGAINCPDCGSAEVRRAPMAPALSGTKASRRDDGPHAAESDSSAEVSSGGAGASGGGGESPTPTPAPESAPSAPDTAVAISAEDAKRIHVMGKIREALVEVRRHVEKNADYVGPKFADEARKIHYGETEERSIYGEASEAESEALADEGIEVGRIPWVPKSDA